MTSFEKEISDCIRYLDLVNKDYPHPTIKGVVMTLERIKDTMSPNAKAIAALTAIRDQYKLKVKTPGKPSESDVKRSDLRKTIDLAIEILQLENGIYS